jgi:hypothetical protein
VLVLAGLCTMPILSGCTALAALGGGSEVDPAAPAAVREATRLRAIDLTAPSEAQGRTTGEAATPGRSSSESDPGRAGKESFTPFSADLKDLRREVALICNSARLSKQQDYLAPLVTDLFLSTIDAASATEALIQGDCGSLEAIVLELVTQGGEAVVDPVVRRALALGGPRSEGTIRLAAAKGLMQGLETGEEPAAGPDPAAGPRAPAMAYFPSRGAEPIVAPASSIHSLYDKATPGYGVYTFVLPGAGFNLDHAADRFRYAEVLRLIETYVLGDGPGTTGPRPESHAFLVAIRPDRRQARLVDQTDPELATSIRAELVKKLRKFNQPLLASRLDSRPGPFLISSLEPRLLPTSETSPRLVADLSKIGNEYLYPVVDAYDNAIPSEQQGRPESLAAIRDRLLGVVGPQSTVVGSGPELKDVWVFQLGSPPAPPSGETAASGMASTIVPTPAASTPTDQSGSQQAAGTQTADSPPPSPPTQSP